LSDKLYQSNFHISLFFTRTGLLVLNLFHMNNIHRADLGSFLMRRFVFFFDSQLPVVADFFCAFEMCQAAGLQLPELGSDGCSRAAADAVLLEMDNFVQRHDSFGVVFFINIVYQKAYIKYKT